MRYGKLLTGGAAATAAFAFAGSAVAQDRPMYELPAIEVSVLQTSLHQQAMALYEFPQWWEMAADLHKLAADNLHRNDAEQFFGYSRAGLLYFYAGKLADARRSMEKAARVAAATGDVLTAAHAFVDAAFISIAEGYGGKKREFVAEARELAGFDLLTPAQRAEILTRIDGAPAGPASARAAMASRFGEPLQLALAH